jgi:hypothetical protein
MLAPRDTRAIGPFDPGMRTCTSTTIEVRRAAGRRSKRRQSSYGGLHMATTTRRATVRRSAPRRVQPAELNSAIKQLLKAIPVDHLDRRLTSIEKWMASIDKDIRKLARDSVGARRPRATAPHRAAAHRKA